MVQGGQITFYTHTYSPYCHRVHLALEEAKAEYTPVTINLMERPPWYNTKINPAGKIPAITYGAPPASPEDPHPEAAKLSESLVIVEFIAELFPDSGLHPADLVQRARARHIITVVETKVFEGFKNFIFGESPVSVLLDGLEAFQARLPETGFAVGDWSIADVAAVPFLARIKLLLENDLGRYPAGEGLKAMEELKKPKFARLMKYIEDAKNRPSFKATWNEEEMRTIWGNNPYLKRN